MVKEKRVGTSRTVMITSMVIQKGFMLIRGVVSRMELEERLPSLQLGLRLMILAGRLDILHLLRGKIDQPILVV